MHTAVGTSARPSSLRAATRSRLPWGRNVVSWTPLWITTVRPSMPSRPPAARSASLTQTVTAVQRVANRSQRRDAARIPPVAAR